MQSWLTLEIDGRSYRVENAEVTRRTLADYLCELGLGSEGAYSDLKPWFGGATVVMIDPDSKGRASYRTIDSSILLLAQTAGRKFITPEGILRVLSTEASEGDDLHPILRAISSAGPLDCGQTGRNNVLAAIFEGYYRRDLERTGQVLNQLDNCLSRSADYRAMGVAATRAFTAAQRKWEIADQKTPEITQEEAHAIRLIDAFDDPYSEILTERAKQPPSIAYVDPKKRRFYRPGTLIELLKLLSQYPNSDLISGGTDMGRQSLRGEIEWHSLISTESITELRAIIFEPDHWEIGSAAPITDIEERLGERVPALGKIIRRFGSRAVRNRATLGGYLATAHPAGELAPLLMALDAQIRLVSLSGERDVPASGFFDTPDADTVLRDGEVIKSVIIPRHNRKEVMAARRYAVRFCDVYKSAPLRTMAHGIVTGGFAVELDKEGIIRKAWLAYSGATTRPVRARRVEAVLAGHPWEEATIMGVLPALNQELALIDDDYASAVYRKQLIITLFQKFFYQHPQPDEAPIHLGAQEEYLKGTTTFLQESQPD